MKNKWKYFVKSEFQIHVGVDEEAQAVVFILSSSLSPNGVETVGALPGAPCRACASIL